MFLSATFDRTKTRSRALTLAVALWVFGIATSIVLIGVWGRSVAGDQTTLAASTRAVLESEIVNDRLADWLGDAVAAAGDVSSDDAAAVIMAVEGSPEMESAIDSVVDQAVAAALAPPGTATELDLRTAIDDLAPVVAAALEQRGVVSDAETVRVAAAGVPGVVLSADDNQLTVGGTAREVRGLLSKVVVAGLAVMALSGSAAVLLNHDRVRQLRSLVLRIGVSAISYAIIFRVGAWAVDPTGGRSPIVSGGAVLLKSNGHVLGAIAIGAAVLAGGISIALVRRRRSALAPSDPITAGETTGEQPVLVGAGAQ